MPKNQGLFPNNVSIVFSKLLFNQQQSTIHSVSFLVSPLTSLLLFFPTNISESQCFQTKHKTRRRKLKNLRLQRAREPQNGFHSPNFDRPSSPRIHCHSSWRCRRGESDKTRLLRFTLWRPEAPRAPRPDCRSLIDLCQDGSQCAQTDAP